MAKFTIPVEHLPAPESDTGNHVFRFRVVSEDKNRLSQYSTLYVLQSKGQIFPLEQSAQVVSSASVINLYWNVPSLYNTGASAVGSEVLHNHETEWKQHPVDLFVSWDSGDYEYIGRSTDDFHGLIKKDGATTAKVRGQIASHPPKVSDIFKIFETENISL